MAKKKLSASQKVELRKELTDSIKGGTSVAETVAAASKKWGLSTVTARWYLKKLGLVVPKPRKGKAKRGPGRPPGSGRPKGLGDVQARAAAAIENARAAQKLMPRWEKLVAREQELRAQTASIAKALKQVSAKAGKIGDHIRALVEV
jgi:hypothetical protein